MFVNITNHPSDTWSEDQISAAHEAYGDVVDVPFPNIPAELSADSVARMALEHAGRVAALAPDAVLLGGEFCFTFALAAALIKRGITVVAATTERVAEETALPDGSVKRVSRYKFVQFREYRSTTEWEAEE